MLTAHEAFELGREVWAVPGRITDDVCRGTNTLFNEGAKAVISIQDFIEKISGIHEQFNLNFDEYIDAPKIKNEKSAPVLSDEEKIIYSILQRQGGKLIDEILDESKLDFMTVQEALMNLEAGGLIINSSARYSATA